MLAPACPPNESERVAALHQLLLLDSPPEGRFNYIVDYVASEFNVPFCLITLIDHDRQWFKARVGLPVCSTPRDISFCGHAILQDDIFVVEDAAADARFFDNPLVTAEPTIRFYAGAPIILPGGEAIGTVCVIDTAPRSFDQAERNVLGHLRDAVLRELLNNRGFQ